MIPTSVRSRLIIGFGIMLLPLVAIALGSLLFFQTALVSISLVVSDPVNEMQAVSRVQIQLLRAAASMTALLHSDGKTLSAVDFKTVARTTERVFNNLLTNPHLSESERQLTESAKNAWEKARLIALDSLDNVSTESTTRNAHDSLIRLDKAVDDLDRIHDLLDHEISEHLASARASRHTWLMTLAVFLVLALVIALSAGWLLARSIIRPLRLLADGAERFGTGDLSHRIQLATSDELGQLSRVFNTMAERVAQDHTMLTELATNDGLTGLYNAREFHRRLGDEVERFKRYGRPLSLILLDFDHFKAINDTYGHQAGDEILRVGAQTLRGCVRPLDQVARYGGEEFSVLLPETDIAGAQTVAERIRAEVGRQIVRIGQDEGITATVSLGVATLSDSVTSKEDFIRCADRALYAAKHAGRNRVCHA